MSNYDVLKIANILSNNLSTQIDKQSMCDNYNSFLLEEQSTGADRSRAALGMSLQLNYFGLLTNSDSPGFDIEIISRSFIELAIHLSKPNKVFSGMISFAMGSTLKNLVPNSHFINIINIQIFILYINQCSLILHGHFPYIVLFLQRYHKIFPLHSSQRHPKN